MIKQEKYQYIIMLLSNEIHILTYMLLIVL